MAVKGAASCLFNLEQVREGDEPVPSTADQLRVPGTGQELKASQPTFDSQKYCGSV